MKGEFTLKILENIKDGIIGMSDLVIVSLTIPYGSSFGRFEYELSELQRERRKEQMRTKTERQTRQRCYNMIYKLERDGLIKKIQKKSGIFFRITSNGVRRWEFLRERKENMLPKPHYKVLKNINFIIVIFDIPEIERKKRSWLRSALKNLGFKLIQKSVWIGKVKIPKDFLNDLKELKLVNFVEIFEISKSGTLQHII